MEIIDLNEEEKTKADVSEVEVLEKESFDKKTKSNKKKNVFIKIKDWFIGLTKKQKIIFFSIVGVLVLAIVGLILYFCFQSDSEPVFSEPTVLSMGSYEYNDGVLYFYSSEEVLLGTYTCSVKSETSCYMSYNLVDDAVDDVVKVYSDYSLITSYIEVMSGLVFVVDDESLLLYDLAEESVVGEYSSAYYAYDNYVILSDLSGDYALADFISGYSLVTDFTYDYIGYVSGNDSFVYLQNSDYGIMSSTGEVLAEGLSGSALNYNDSYVVTKSGTTYSLVDYDGEVLLSGYDYIKLYDGYVYGVKSEELYVFNENLSKVNEVGIEFTDASYGNGYGDSIDRFYENNEFNEFTDYAIYNTYLSLIENDYLVEYEFLSDQSLKVLGNTYNVHESAINETLSFMNYISGVWYFYSDEDKTDLLGSYTCDVENNVSSSSDSYSSCYVASNTDISGNDVSGVLPVLYNRYVFMYDTQVLTINSNIVLYDLSSDYAEASFSSVDLFELSSLGNGLSFINNSVTAFAKDSSGNLGMFTLSSSGLTTIIDFSYSSFSYLDEYLVFTDSSGYKLLYESDGTCLNGGSKISNEILEYYNGYLVVNVSGNKQIYSSSGTIVSDAYSNIMFEDDCYLGISSDNSLSVYKYDNSSINYFSSSIDLDYSYLMFYQVDSEYVSITLYDEENIEMASYSVYIGA